MKIILWIAAACLAWLPSAHQHKVAKNGEIRRIMGADISFLPQLEAEGKHFYDHGVQKDAIQMLKDNGFNFIRLRTFVDPTTDSGYSKEGYCGLEDTKKMALRVKAAHLGFLLDFHYSDYWADPGKQFKPKAWRNLSNAGLDSAIGAYTRKVLQALKDQGTSPDMVQVGNEINHGILWPDGRIAHLDTLAGFLKAGIAAVREVTPGAAVMLHIACGGGNTESRYFIDNMLSRGVAFDIIGQSYYPQWHGTLSDLKNNITDLASRYKQDIIVVEYSALKQQVNDIAQSIPGKRFLGTFIWEPLNWGETVVDQKTGQTDSLMDIYPALAKKYDIR